MKTCCMMRGNMQINCWGIPRLWTNTALYNIQTVCVHTNFVRGLPPQLPMTQLWPVIQSNQVWAPTVPVHDSHKVGNNSFMLLGLWCCCCCFRSWSATAEQGTVVMAKVRIYCVSDPHHCILLIYILYILDPPPPAAQPLDGRC